MTKQIMHTMQCDFMTNGHWFRLVGEADKISKQVKFSVYSKKSEGQLILVDNDNLPQKIYDNVKNLTSNIADAMLGIFNMGGL